MLHPQIHHCCGRTAQAKLAALGARIEQTGGPRNIRRLGCLSGFPGAGVPPCPVFWGKQKWQLQWKPFPFEVEMKRLEVLVFVHTSSNMQVLDPGFRSPGDVHRTIRMDHLGAKVAPRKKGQSDKTESDFSNGEGQSQGRAPWKARASDGVN